MFKEYKTVLDKVETEIEIKKSRFISNIKRCNTEEEAIEFISEIRKKYKAANHNCTAYIIGENKNIQRYNDDGEPQGTAGIPMLEVLLKEDLTNLCVVVTRYFGGIKLGGSGLIRAYGSSVAEALKNIKKINLKNYYKISLDFDYGYLGKIDNYIGENKYFVKERHYLESIKNILYINVLNYESFKNDIFEMTSANVQLEILDNILLQVYNDEIIE